MPKETTTKRGMLVDESASDVTGDVVPVPDERAGEEATRIPPTGVLFSPEDFYQDLITHPDTREILRQLAKM